MCGIAGIIQESGAPVSDSESSLLVNALVHRGPDGHGVWFSNDRSAALVHTRLSVLDLSESGSQPMRSNDGRYVIAYNGEIYNFLELRGILSGLGSEFVTDTDTEVILEAWKQWGQGMLAHFNGMWAFAIHDTREDEWFLARDRYGVKPLYYHEQAGRIAFASEIQALQQLDSGRFAPNPDFLSRFLQYDVQCFGTEDTWLSGIKALPAGHYLTWKRGRISVHQWYWLEPTEVPRRFSDQVERFRELLIDACRLRLRSDVPVATCLSGGLDSGSIVSVLGRAFGTDAGKGRSSQFSHRSFNAAFPGSSLDESADARAIAAKAGMSLDSFEMICPSPEELESALASCDGPMPTLAFFPIWRLYRHIKQSGITVTLDGQGADEMLGGYYLGESALRGGWQSGRLLWMRDLARTYSAIHPEAPMWMRSAWSEWRRITATACEHTVKNPAKNALAFFGAYDLKRTKPLRRPELPAHVRSGYPGARNELATALFRQFFIAPLPFLHHQYDRCSMASGVECRMPFMDFRLVEYVFSLPLPSRIGHGFTKRILRESMRGILPEHVRTNRTKTGFNAPFSDWFNGPLREWAGDLRHTPEFAEAKAMRDELLPHTVSNRTDSANERTQWPVLHLAFELRRRKVRTNCSSNLQP
jgi:asparagine synthase (glutamine-hydrolysing)